MSKKSKKSAESSDNWTANYTKDKWLSDLFTVALYSLRRGEDLDLVLMQLEGIRCTLEEDGVLHKRRTVEDMDRERLRNRVS